MLDDLTMVQIKPPFSPLSPLLDSFSVDCSTAAIYTDAPVIAGTTVYAITSNGMHISSSIAVYFNM